MTLPIFNADRLRALRALRAKLKGRANYVYLPNFDGRYLREPPNMEAAVVSSVDRPARSTTITIQMSSGYPLRIGTQFGLGGTRLYEVAQINSQTDATRVMNLDIWPPLRVAASTEEPLQFAALLTTCLMRCVNMDQAFRTLTDLTWTEVNLDFVEYF